MTATLTRDTPLMKIPRRGLRAIVHRPDCRYITRRTASAFAGQIPAAKAQNLVACKTCLPNERHNQIFYLEDYMTSQLSDFVDNPPTDCRPMATAGEIAELLELDWSAHDNLVDAASDRDGTVTLNNGQARRLLALARKGKEAT